MTLWKRRTSNTFSMVGLDESIVMDGSGEMRVRSINASGSGLVLAVVLGGASAFAQTASEPEGLEEITVTATRAARSIQEVPLSISAYDQNSITRLAMSNVEDLARLTPGLDETLGNTGIAIISIRGIYSTVGTATTGVYIDDTPIQVRFLGAGSAAGSAYPALFDLDRVEVLRGPQGTLFGSGSEGGTVRFITPQAGLSSWNGHARGEFSTYSNGVPSSQFGLAGGGPLLDGKLGVRVSAYVQNDGGWVDRSPYPGDDFPDRNTNSSSTQAVNLALSWAPADGVSVTPALYYQRSKQDNQNGFWLNTSNIGAGQFLSNDIVAQPTLDRLVLPSLRVQWDLPGVSLYSNTSYLDRASDATLDYSIYLTELLTGNFTGPHTAAPAYFRNPQRQFTQEIRAQSSDIDARLHWVVGAFYQQVKQKADEFVVAPQLGDLTQTLFGLSVADLFGFDALPGGIVYLGKDISTDKQVAGFGQLDWRVTDAWTITAGVRVSHSSFSYTNVQDGPFNGGPSGSSGGSSENDTTPKVGITYKPSRNLMFYGSAAKGFRPGGSNTPVSAILCEPDLTKLGLTSAPSTYTSDHVWSYELGAKGSALARRLQWDASAFYIRWSGIESSVALPSCGFQYIGNLGGATSKGFDLQINALVGGGLTIGVSLGYTDAKYSETVAGAGTKPIVTKGERLQIAPWHAALSADYSFSPFSNGLTPYLHLDGQFTNSYRVGNSADALYDPVVSLYDSTKFATARVGFKVGAWDVSAFAKNLFNSHPILLRTHYYLASDLVLGQSFAPRLIGVTATYAF